VAAVAKKKTAEDKYKEKKSEIDESSIEELQVQLTQLKDKLEWFASKHQHVLKTDPMFRQEFIQMCAAIGVDPLASSKGFWTEFLGVGTFYYQLAVQGIEIVLSGAAYHGGVMRLEDLWKQLVNSRSSYLEHSRLSCDDVIQAFDILEVIGKSCGVIRTGAKQVEHSLIFCVPEELSLDNTTVIQTIAQSGKACFTVAELEEELGWPHLRVTSATDKLLRDGIIWVDLPRRNDASGVALYWFPGLFFNTV